MKLVTILLSCLSLFGSVVPGVTQIVDAAEKTASVPAENHFQLDKVTIVESNELYKNFVQEVNRPEIKQQLMNQSDSAETKALIQSLILKYDALKSTMLMVTIRSHEDFTILPGGQKNLLMVVSTIMPLVRQD